MAIKERFVETEFAEYWYEDGIVFGVFKPNTRLNLEMAKKAVAARMSVSSGMKTPMCMDIRNLVTADLDAHRYMASREAVINVSAGAFIQSGVISRMLMHIWMTIFKPVVPAAPFANREEAIEWLQKFKYLN